MENLHLISDEDVATFQADGALCLRGAIDEKWIELLRKGITYNRLHPSERTKRKGHGNFFHDYGNWCTVPEYQEFIFGSPVSGIAGKILQSDVRHNIVRVYLARFLRSFR